MEVQVVSSVNDPLSGLEMCSSPLDFVITIPTLTSKVTIYIGDHNAAANLGILRSRGITHIINCAAEIRNYHESRGVKYFNLGLLDSDDPIIPVVTKAYNYIKRESGEGPIVVLIHCHMGMSRSASMVIYYLMKETDLSFGDALKFLKKRRPIVNPNASYRLQFLNYFGHY